MGFGRRRSHTSASWWTENRRLAEDAWWFITSVPARRWRMFCLIGRLRGITVILGRCSDEIQFGQFRAAYEQIQKLSLAPPALVLALVVSPGLTPWATF